MFRFSKSNTELAHPCLPSWNTSPKKQCRRRENLPGLTAKPAESRIFTFPKAEADSQEKHNSTSSSERIFFQVLNVKKAKIKVNAERERARERMESGLVGLCIEAACQSKESVEKWRRQRRSLERLPSHLADALLRRLLCRRLLYPSLLDAEEINLRGENTVDAEWMAYLGAFRNLRSLNVADCHRVTSSALWAMTGMSCLQELDLSRCLKLTDAGIRHLTSISTLEKLYISETGLTAGGVPLLASLKNLSVLDLGGLPVTDQALSSLQVLTKLQYLDLWGHGGKAPLTKLIFAGATVVKEAEAFTYVETSFLTFLDVSKSSLQVSASYLI
ncbi:F-box/LRR-repeat protein 16 [Morella rubra]|uniref:F-box/LRR-repeat protein 16 n=1 Tax=Morella rubra TaxID=262757 RepID=A0A6A1VAQ9_9ROSI|nr:F-box/LRR-repeat protein 16 [Morella rubra]